MSIWITGVGAATPLGNSYATIADNLLAGRSGVREVTTFPTDDQPSRVAGQIECSALDAAGLDWSGSPGVELRDAAASKEANAFRRLALWCAANALRDAGLWEARHDLRIGLVLGAAAEWNWTWEMDFFRWGGQGVFQEEEHGRPVTQWLKDTLGLGGPTIGLSAACASGNYAIALGKRWLELGWVDYCLAGGADLTLTPMILAGFGNLRALSRRNDEPRRASRPFDRGRDGFVLGEGGVVFLLEREPTARRRRARRYAEVAGHGASSDAWHLVIPSADPAPAARAMRLAFEDARINPGDVDYLNAHATGTPVGDVAETRVLHTVFESHIRRLPVSSTKSMTGHLLTAAAAFEALACIVAINEGALPPTINLEDADPECDLCHIANQAREARVDVAASNAFGFGGSNTCLVLRRAG